MRYADAMPRALFLEEAPLAPPREVGPYRRADYLALPDEPRHELIYGRLYVSPSPVLLHQIVVTALWRLLDEIAAETGGLVVVAPMDVTLADHSVVQPDVVYVSRERRRVLGERVEGPPSLVVEVLSPGTARRDRGEKLKLYSEFGVDEYWIIDPTERQIEHLVNREGDFVVTLPDGPQYQSTAVPDLSIDIERFWSEVGRRATGLPAPTA
jgi:Uma2 family endonuclease